jgi:hypothetical protein
MSRALLAMVGTWQFNDKNGVAVDAVRFNDVTPVKAYSKVVQDIRMEYNYLPTGDVLYGRRAAGFDVEFTVLPQARAQGLAPV